MSPFYIAIISIFISVVAQFLLKAGMNSDSVRQILYDPPSIRTISTVFTNRNIIFGFALYGLGAVLWLGVLSKWDVSKAYPLVGFGFVLTLVISFFTGEHITTLRIVGVALIGVGITLVSQT